MYYLLYTNNANLNIWESIEDKDAVNERIEYLREHLGIDAKKIGVIFVDPSTVFTA